MKKNLTLILLLALFVGGIFQMNQQKLSGMQIFSNLTQNITKRIPTNLYEKRNETKGIVIHNDAGNSSGSEYKFLKDYNTSQLSSGFAHYYVAKNDVYNFWNDDQVAWHTGNKIGNAEYIGIEVTNSFGLQADFLANEQESFKLAAQLLKKYGLEPNIETIKLHREFYKTECPHRSMELHGNDVDAVKQYFIQQITNYYNN